MNIAIVHDYIKEYGGAERVLETLLEIYPDAIVFTSLYAPEFLGPHKERFEKYNIKTTFLNLIPFRHRLISPLRLLSPFAFSSLDLSNYDVVIVSQTGAYFPNIVGERIKKQELRIKDENHKPSAISHRPILICYTHTPPRYLYGYATARDWKKNKFFAFFAHIANHFLRMVDYSSSKNVDYFIANSEEVAARIKKFYRREAAVIYPPVGIDFAKSEKAKKRKSDIAPLRSSSTPFYLTGGRLARAKGIDVIVRAFNENGLPLKIFGKGFAGYESELRELANGKWQMADSSSRLRSNNIEFLGEVSDDEKLELMKNAKAFVFASYDEDFGITPVEAMSMGTPVIAYRSGGVKETVIEGKTGLFFDENTADALNTAVKKFEILRQAPHFAKASRGKQDDKMSKDCIKQAEKFSKEHFIDGIEKFVNSKISKTS